MKLKVLLTYFILSYGLFFYAYKFSQPDIQGLKDYEQYQLMYNGWNFNEVESPFNTRIISTYGIYLLNNLGVYYDNQVAISDKRLEKKVFFNALFFNYLSIVFTAWFVFLICHWHNSNFLISFTTGLLYFVSFGTFYFALNPLTEAFSILMATAIYFLYLKRSNWIFLLLLLAIIQREYIFFVFSLLALIELFKIKSLKQSKYQIMIFAACVVGFITYYILRNTFFYTPHHDEQLKVGSFITNLLNSSFPFWPYFKQTILIQNIVGFYLILVLHNKIKLSHFNLADFATIVLLMLQAIFISYIAILGNSAGRYFYTAIAVVLFFISKELIFLKSNWRYLEK